ncbi:hypothetical protein [Rhodococcus sp. 311R]|uniref:hypothetical protein n=1 Tax=Rhodococcus sp. 311R TaxID=1617904 RepID=UPI000A82AA3A|nr:hypothetical protein [Rhodococcus sp. 311R]
MGWLYMFASAFVHGGRRRRKRAGPLTVAIRKRQAEKRYVANAVRRRELNDKARRIYNERNPKPTPRQPASPPQPPTPRQLSPPSTYKDPRDFWTRW